MAELPTSTSWAPEIQGLPGKSAYEIAVDEGFLGSEAQWLATLVGPQGDQGTQGIQGETGAAGVMQSVVAGANITVDNTDPANPVIAATGGGGGGSAGIAANWPSGASYFLNAVGSFVDCNYDIVGRAKVHMFPVDSDATFTGIEYSIAIADGTAEVWIEIHECLGAGTPGALMASVQIDTSVAATGKTVNFAAPVAFPAGMYYVSMHTVNAGAGTGRIDGISLSSSSVNTFYASLYISNYWTFLGSTTELPAVSLAETALPGGSFTPGANWTGSTFINTDITATGLIPFIGLIKQ